MQRALFKLTPKPKLPRRGAKAQVKRARPHEAEERLALHRHRELDRELTERLDRK